MKSKLFLLLKLFPVFLLIFAFFTPSLIHGFNIAFPGQGINPGTDNAETLVGNIIGNAIIIVFTVAAVAVLAMVLWGAVEWIFSGGDKEKVGNARKRITYALIGLVLIALTFVILTIVGEILEFDVLKGLRIPSLGDGLGTSVTDLPDGSTCVVDDVDECLGDLICRGETPTCQAPE